MEKKKLSGLCHQFAPFLKTYLMCITRVYILCLTHNSEKLIINNKLCENKLWL